MKTIAQCYAEMDGQRQTKLDRARYSASLTIPQLLPYEGWDESEEIQLPYSSVGGQGVVSLASKMLSAMLPVDGQPFFRFEPADGSQPDPDTNIYLENLAHQVNRKLQSNNLRDTLFDALQQLIVSGDTLFVMNDDFSFYTIRLDQYVVERSPSGDVEKFIYLEFTPDPDHSDDYPGQVSSFTDPSSAAPHGFLAVYNELKWDGEKWNFRREIDGQIVETGSYTVENMVPVRWSAVTGEHYGRAKCEELAGDLQSLESYTQSLIESMAASSRFYIGVNPAGMADVDDIMDTPNGGFVGAKPDDIFTVSPSQSMNANIQATQAAVNTMRAEVAKAFLMQGGSIRDAERVTAAEVRMVGAELEQVLGGAFSAIARELLGPVIRRAFFLLIEQGEIDPQLAGQLNEGGVLNAEVVTGLQAFSRDTDLSNLMQMGQMVQNLPPQAQERFNWASYATTLVSSLGFDPRNWVKSDEQMAAEQAQAQEMQMQQQMQEQAMATIGQAATQDIQQTGGQNIAAAAQQMMPPM